MLYQRMGTKAMKITDPSLHFDLLSVIELHLPAQNCIIAPRQYSTLSFRLQGGALIEGPGGDMQIGVHSILFIPAGYSYHIKSQQEVVFVYQSEYSKPGNFGAASLYPTEFSCFPGKLPVYFRHLVLKAPGLLPQMYVHALHHFVPAG